MPVASTRERESAGDDGCTSSVDDDDDSEPDRADRARLRFLQSLHLILPVSMVPVGDVDVDGGHAPPSPSSSSSSSTALRKTSEFRARGTAAPFASAMGPHPKRRLRGYETLQELRDLAASFRQGYLNWRKFKPKGAKGETTDLFTGRKPSATPAKVEISILHQQASKAATDPRGHHSYSAKELAASHHSSNGAGNENIPPSLVTPAPQTVLPAANLLEAPQCQDSHDRHHPLRRREGGKHHHFRLHSKQEDQQQHERGGDEQRPSPGSGSATTATSMTPVASDLGVRKTLDDEEEWLRFYYNPFTPASTIPATPVRSATLSHLASRGVRVPTYSRDPGTVTHWILHIGVGQFHRSHQLVFLDDLLSSALMKHPPSTVVRTALQSVREGAQRATPPQTEQKWGYCGVGLMPFDLKMTQTLRRQDLLYTVMSKTNVSSSVRIIGSMFEYVFACEEPEVALKKLVDPNLHIVSMTITEKGYCQSVNGSLDLENPLVQHDLHLFQNGFTRDTKVTKSPKTALGFLYWGLRERHHRGRPPFTIMSCDNLPENGHVAKSMVTAFAHRVDPQFATWIHDNVRFPSSMVDRITPATVLEHREILVKDYGVADEWPVVTEEFMQWAIEDNFTCRPPWETVGALLVSDVRPLELMKLRLLNGGHSMIGYISYLAGYQFVDDAVNDIKISSFLRAYMDEMTSTIRNVSIELERYKEKIVERFGNRMIKDRLLRLCEDGSTKLYNTTKDALTELVTEDRHIHCTALGLAAFVLFLATSPSDTILDAKKDFLVQLAKNAVSHVPSTFHVAEFLRNVYGSPLGQAPCLVNHTCLALLALKVCSVERVLHCGGTLEALFDRHMCSAASFDEFLAYVMTAAKTTAAPTAACGRRL